MDSFSSVVAGELFDENLIAVLVVWCAEEN